MRRAGYQPRVLPNLPDVRAYLMIDGAMSFVNVINAFTLCRDILCSLFLEIWIKIFVWYLRRSANVLLTQDTITGDRDFLV